MKTILSLVVFLCAYTTSFSQMILAPSQVMSIDDNPQFMKTDYGTITVSKTGKSGSGKWNKANYSMSLALFDKNTTMIVKNDLSNGDYVYNRVDPRLVKSGNSLWLIYAEPGTKLRIGNIVAEEFDIKTLKSLGKSTIVTEDELDENDNISFYIPIFDFIVKNSPDSKYHSLFIDNGKGDFFISCLDNNMKPLWKKKQGIPGYNHEDINGISVNNDGTVFITASKNGTADVCSFTAAGVVTNQTISIPGDIKAEKIKVLAGNNNELYLGGVGMKDSKYVNNFFLGKLSKDGNLTAFKSLDIPDSIISRLRKDDLAKDNSRKSGIKPLRINPDLVQQKDGRIKMTVECKAGLGRDEMQYMAYGGLVIADFDATQKNFLLIPKYTIGNYPFLSDARNQFVTVTGDNKITLYYFDNADNLERPLSEPQKVLKGSSNAALFAAEIGNDGIIKRKFVSEIGN